MLKIAQFLGAVSPTLLSIWLVLHLAVQGVLGGVEAPGNDHNLLAVSARLETIWVVVSNRGILWKFVQSSINTAYFASC
ncbi:MAG: hypothetical protein WB711_05730 [Terriglobales bacterium]